MAGTSFFALLDDIATILDDVALMTKVAAKKSAGVLGDDLALNAQQVSGVSAERELPVVWAVAKGSALNKLILVPAALAISALAPWAILPLLMLGGIYLCFEGVEKLAHSFWHKDPEQDAAAHAQLIHAVTNPAVDMVAFEKDKIKGAIRTDFILSAEIIVIALGTVAGATFMQQVMVVSGIAILMTVGVYGLVAGIVKLDDVGLYLTNKADALRQTLGRMLVLGAPYLMRALSIIGTAAMFMVGGGILTHGVPALHHLSKAITLSVSTVAAIGGMLALITPLLVDVAVGLLAGVVALSLVEGATGIFKALKKV